MLFTQRHPLPFNNKNLLSLTYANNKVPTSRKDVAKSIYQTTQYKYGRNSMLQQAKQVNQSFRNSPFLFRTTRRIPIYESRNEKEKQKVRISWRNKYRNDKKRTYSNQQYFQNAQQQTKNHIQPAYTNRKEHNSKVNTSQKTNMQQLRRQTFAGKAFIKTKRDRQRQQNHMYGKQQEETNFKITIKHNRFASIDISQNTKQKASFVELISKFQFKNLKTAHQTTSSSRKSIKIQNKQANKLQKTVPYKKKIDDQQISFNILKNRIKSASKGFRKYELIHKRCQNTQRKTNSILSPWATDSRIVLQAMDLDI